MSLKLIANMLTIVILPPKFPAIINALLNIERDECIYNNASSISDTFLYFVCVFPNNMKSHGGRLSKRHLLRYFLLFKDM